MIRHIFWRLHFTKFINEIIIEALNLSLEEVNIVKQFHLSIHFRFEETKKKYLQNGS